MTITSVLGFAYFAVGEPTGRVGILRILLQDLGKSKIRWVFFGYLLQKTSLQRSLIFILTNKYIWFDVKVLIPMDINEHAAFIKNLDC